MDTVGFIGLGNMGLPMCERLVGAGHRVVAFDLDPARVMKAVDAGASAAASAATFAPPPRMQSCSCPRSFARRSQQPEASRTMNEDEPLPELLQAEWTRDQVMALFADLAAGAIVQQVQLRTSSSDQAVTLADAKASFVADQARAIQVRYLFEGELWSDTIIPGNPTTKIIRNRLPVG